VKTIVSLLWPSGDHVLVELARAGWLSFAWLTPPQQAVLAQLTSLGARGRSLTLDPARLATYPAEVERRAEALAGTVARAMAPLGTSRGRESEVVAAAAASYRAGIDASLQLIDAIDEVHRSDGVAALVLNETETRNGRVPARWARSRNVPVFMVTHGANLNRYYTCTAGLETDYAYVYGERGMDAFVDQGVPPERLKITGNPGWETLTQLRANASELRAQVVAAAGFRPELPIVLFATTWSAKLSAFGDATLQERVARAVFTACALLERAGTPCNLLVKARPLDRMGEAELTQLGAEVGLSRFGFMNGPMDVPLAASDLVVGFDTSSFVSAMLLEVPCVNLWGETSWVFGPPFAGYDAIPLVLLDDPPGLAGVMRELLFDPEARRNVTAAASARVGALSVPGDGAAARVAAHVASVLPRPESMWAMVDASGRDVAVAGGEAHPALVANVPEGSRSIFACDAGAAIAAQLGLRFPDASIRTSERDAERIRWSEVAGDSLDAIVLPGTLHRCLQPQAFLQSMRANAGNATVVAAVDNIRNLWLARDLVKGTLRYGHRGPLALDHLRWFSIEEAMALFRSAGYTVRRVEGISDPRRASLGTPPAEGTFDLALPELVVRGLNAAAYDELTAEAWIVVATP
jgi:hypothetical protein